MAHQIQQTRSSNLAACPFCNIARCFPPFDSLLPPDKCDASLDPHRTAPGPDSFVVISTPLVVAFLDNAPLAEGHLLLCPRQHREKLTDVSATEASELGRWLQILSAAVTRAVGVEDWNVVQNNGVAAAQVVPHAHFHIIPRPEIRRQGRWSERFTMFGRGQRTDLDENEGVELAERVRVCLVNVLHEKAALYKGSNL